MKTFTLELLPSERAGAHPDRKSTSYCGHVEGSNLVIPSDLLAEDIRSDRAGTAPIRLIGAYIRRPFGRYGRAADGIISSVEADLPEDLAEISNCLNRMSLVYPLTCVSRSDRIVAEINESERYQARIVNYLKPAGLCRSSYLTKLFELQRSGGHETFRLGVNPKAGPDVWFDVANDCVVTFDRVFANRLITHLHTAHRNLKQIYIHGEGAYV